MYLIPSTKIRKNKLIFLKFVAKSTHRNVRWICIIIFEVIIEIYFISLHWRLLLFIWEKWHLATNYVIIGGLKSYYSNFCDCSSPAHKNDWQHFYNEILSQVSPIDPHKDSPSQKGLPVLSFNFWAKFPCAPAAIPQCLNMSL